MIELLGSSPINTAVTVGMGKFMSIFRRKVSNAFGDDPSRYSRPYTSVRGVLINKEYLDAKPLDLTRGYQFQFNPQTIDDVKNTLYEVRPYAGLPYNDYIWAGGGERIITFQLFLDNTPQSKTPSFRPSSYGSKEAKSIQLEGLGYGYDGYGRVTSVELGKSSGKLGEITGISLPKPGPTSFEYKENDAYSKTRVDQRGILPEVEKLQSFLYPAPLTGESTPLFSEGGVVSMNQFRPPATVVLALGPIYLEGVIKSAPVHYSLFDQDLTPLRGTVDIEFGVFEFSEIVRKIDWEATK